MIGTLLNDSYRIETQLGEGGIVHARILNTMARALAQQDRPAEIARAKRLLEECLALLEHMGDSRKADRVRGELAAPQVT